MLGKRISVTLGVAIICGAGALALNLAHGEDANNANERVVKIVAQRFHYTPGDIEVKTGEAVRLEITSLDFMHGFNIPDLKVRASLPPGQVTVIHLRPMTAGTYDFLCDNFCGSGHEEMNGRIVVRD